MLCSEIVGRAKCIVPEAVFRERYLVDSLAQSGRSTSRRYHEQLLQYHYLLSDQQLDSPGRPEGLAGLFSGVRPYRISTNMYLQIRFKICFFGI